MLNKSCCQLLIMTNHREFYHHHHHPSTMLSFRSQLGGLFDIPECDEDSQDASVTMTNFNEPLWMEYQERKQGGYGRPSEKGRIAICHNQNDTQYQMAEVGHYHHYRHPVSANRSQQEKFDRMAANAPPLQLLSTPTRS